MDLVKAEMLKYPNASLVWVQEEPKNMGAWSYSRPRFEATLKKEGSGRIIKWALWDSSLQNSSLLVECNNNTNKYL